MKVAVAASGPDLEANVEPRFGRCACFVVVDTETMEFEALDNPGALAGTGAGIAAAQVIADAGAEAVVAGTLGPNALQALRLGGLTIYEAAGGTVREAAQAAAAGQLQTLA